MTSKTKDTKSITVGFAHTAVNKDMHLFIGDMHRPDLCAECIEPGSLTDGSGMITIRSNGTVRWLSNPSTKVEPEEQ